MPRNDLDGITTRRGRVVYDREPSRFTFRDLERILKKIASRKSEGILDPDPDTLVNLINLIVAIDPGTLRTADFDRIMGWLEKSSSWEGFSGGMFGGAGSTRGL